MISYEGSKWYIKVWRHRWYIYAFILYLKVYLSPDLWISYILELFQLSNFDEDEFLDEEKKKLKSNWEEIRKHVEISKMRKLSSKYQRDD